MQSEIIMSKQYIPIHKNVSHKTNPQKFGYLFRTLSTQNSDLFSIGLLLGRRQKSDPENHVCLASYIYI